jgi:hypothetical protein
MKHEVWMSLLAAMSMAALAGCDEGDGEGAGKLGDVEERTVELDITGLEDLGPGAVYEGWLIVDGEPVTTGRFTVEDGVASATEFAAEAADAESATKFVLTIEPAVDDDPAPSAHKLLAGDFVEGQATIAVDDPAALGSDFTDAAGQFFLQTPTSPEPDDYDLGIWFLDAASGTPTLDLPELPDGWVYEGWVVTNDGPITTGRFTDPAGADSDGAGPTAGPAVAPAFPGSDFITPPVSLIGAAAVISIEPEPDNSPEPFLLKPLLTASMEELPPPALQDLGNNALSTNPVGAVTLR